MLKRFVCPVAIPSYVRSIQSQNGWERYSTLEEVAIPSYVRSIQSWLYCSEKKRVPNLVAIPSYVRSIQSPYRRRLNLKRMVKSRNPFVSQVDSVAAKLFNELNGLLRSQSLRMSGRFSHETLDRWIDRRKRVVAIPSYVRSIQSHRTLRHSERRERGSRNPFVCQVDSVCRTLPRKKPPVPNVAIPSYVRSIQSNHLL